MLLRALSPTYIWPVGFAVTGIVADGAVDAPGTTAQAEENIQGNAMHVTIVHVQVRPEHVADFMAASLANHRGSVAEPGNRRFDVLQSPEDPTRFLLYEAYATEADAAAHKQTAHYLAWREAVAPMMAAPRQGVPWTCLAPE